MPKEIRVLVVDGSAAVRKVFSEQLSKQNGLLVVGTAPDPYVAREKIVRLKPDVITLDIQMPRMDGLTFLKKLMRHYPLPVIIVSSPLLKDSKLVREALSLGALDFIFKPDTDDSVADMSLRLADKIRAVCGTRPGSASRHVPPNKSRTSIGALAPASTSHRIIAIGASTGGAEAIKNVLTRLPHNSPGVLVVQHMPAQFTASFAKRLDELSRMRVKEAEDGDRVVTGQALIAPGNYHMTFKQSGGRSYVEVKKGPFVHYQRPAVDVLFKSVARFAGADALGIILTGMGRDGAAGMLEMKKAGAINIAQDENSSVVFGMPKEAIRIGAVDYVLNIHKIADKATSLLETM